MKFQDIKLIKGNKTKPYEYLCNNCGQLRLAFVVVDECQNCFSPNIIKGQIGTLEKKKLKT